MDVGRGRGVGLGLAACALALAVSGCGAGDTEPRVLESDGVHLLVGADPDEGNDAIVRGTVAVLGTCLGITTEGGDFVILWPRGTRFVDDEDGPAIRLPGLRRTVVHPGDHIDGAGGGQQPWQGDPELPATCSTRDGTTIRGVTVIDDPSYD